MAGFSVADLTAKTGKNNTKLSKQQKDLLKKYKVASPYEEKDTKKKSSAKPAVEEKDISTKTIEEAKSPAVSISNNTNISDNQSKTDKTEVEVHSEPAKSELANEKSDIVSSGNTTSASNQAEEKDNSAENTLTSQKESPENKPVEESPILLHSNSNSSESNNVAQENMLPEEIKEESKDLPTSNFEDNTANSQNINAVDSSETSQPGNATGSNIAAADSFVPNTADALEDSSAVISNIESEIGSDTSGDENQVSNISYDENESQSSNFQSKEASAGTSNDDEQDSKYLQDSSNIYTNKENDSVISKDTESPENIAPKETPKASELVVSNEFIEDSDDEDDNDDDGYVYGEADPEQFVYYHRKDIRLKLHTGEKRRQLLESIRTSGIHEPILVRQATNGKLEIIAGHNRQDIARELGIKVPYFLIPNVNDEYADQICVDTNLLNRQHSEMLPSELSNMLAVKRKMFTLERLSDEFHIANTTMKAFLKLQDLLPELLYGWVDTKKIGMTVGYALACHDREHQHDLLDYLNENNIKTISVKQGKEISNRGILPWDKEFLDHIFGKTTDNRSAKPQTKVSLSYKELGKYLDMDELQDPKRALYNLLSLRKKAEAVLASNNLEYSEDIIIDALESYIYRNN